MRWFLTDDRTLIPEKSIVKIRPTPDGRAEAYILDQRGVLGTAMLEAKFEELTKFLSEEESHKKR